MEVGYNVLLFETDFSSA